MIEIKALSVKTADDFFDLFENRIFADDNNSACYCTAWSLTEEEQNNEIDALIINGKLNMREACGKTARKLIKCGRLNGYLAYIDGVSAGWCNADDKRNYACHAIPAELAQTEVSDIKSIMCFHVALPYRHKGVAAALLSYVCFDARQNCYDYVEAYPRKSNFISPDDYYNVIRIYHNCGFDVISSDNNKEFLRKKL